MKKSEQLKINDLCIEKYNEALKELTPNTISRQLRTCNAIVYDTKNYYILRSYETIIAVINKNTDTLYDVLRIVYGYTPTSCKQIAKFKQDYCQGQWSCLTHYTAR